MRTENDLPIAAYINRLRAQVEADPRVESALLYGSWTMGEADRHSDLDAYIFIRDEEVAGFDGPSFAASIAPTLLTYTNMFGVFAVVFEDLTRAELHLDAATSGIEAMAQWAGLVWFPDASRAVLLDRTGRLSAAVAALGVEQPPEPRATAQQLSDDLANWTLMMAHLLERGELARAHAGSQVLVAPLQLKLCRLLRGSTRHWLTPSRALEADLAAEDVRRYAATTSSMEEAALREATRASWAWSRELIEEAARRWQITYAAALHEALSAKLTG